MDGFQAASASFDIFERRDVLADLTGLSVFLSELEIRRMSCRVVVLLEGAAAGLLEDWHFELVCQQRQVGCTHSIIIHVSFGSFHKINKGLNQF